MSDIDIKSANIERYYGKILSNMAAYSDEDLNNAKNINRLILSYIRSRYSIISIINDDPSISRLASMGRAIRDVVINKGSENSIKIATRDLKHLTTLCSNIERGYIESINSIENSPYSNLIMPIIEILLSIGDLIHEYCKKVELNNLYDYTSVCIKIKSTRAAFLDDQYRLSSEVRTIIENFYYSSDVRSYISNNRFMNGLASESVKDLYKLKAIYKHTKSMFT